MFAASYAVLRLFTDRISKVRVRFFKPVEIFGGIFFGLWTAWIVMSFALMTLHMAPLVTHSFGGSFHPPDNAELMFFGIGPDRKWLAFNQKLSKEAYATSDQQVFDKDSDFVIRYNDRRATIEADTSDSLLIGK